MGLLYGRTGRLTALFGDFWPGQDPPRRLKVFLCVPVASMLISKGLIALTVRRLDRVHDSQSPVEKSRSDARHALPRVAGVTIGRA